MVIHGYKRGRKWTEKRKWKRKWQKEINKNSGMKEHNEEDGYLSDGINPNKGTASSTPMTFKIIYESQRNEAPTYMDLVVNDGTTTQRFPMMIDQTASSTLKNGIFQDKEQYIYKDIAQKGKYQYHFEASDGITTLRFPSIEELTFETGYSNLLFLPGLQASRLYDSNGDLIWEPGNNTEAIKTELNLDGASKNPDIYVKDRDIIDEITSAPIPQPNIYKSFMKKMDDLVNVDRTINEWSPVAYDWRLSFDVIVNNGYKQNGNIYYSYATSTPYIVQELKRLASTSANGKVTIVTHSMGGLIAKTLIKKLEDENDPAVQNIDKLIMVAAPQLGTPKAITALLHGEDTSLFKRPFLNQGTKRYLAQNMQSAYNLLPSQKYFQVVDTNAQPIIEFDLAANFTQIFRDKYGDNIKNFTELNSFLIGEEGRTKPEQSDLFNPEVLQNILLVKAKDVHSNSLDDWLPPENIEVTQIAGWGDNETLRGIRYSQKQNTECSIFTLPICQTTTVLDPQPLFTEDGDGTVIVPSAFAVDEENYYLNLNSYNDNFIVNRDHSNILEVESLFDLVKEKIIGTFNKLSLPQYLSSTKPFSVGGVRLALHSPVSINVYDDHGNHTGLAYDQATNSYYPEEQIPNSYYMEFGEGKYLGFDAKDNYTIKLQGEDYGTFTFEVEKVLGDETLQQTVFSDIPVSPSTKADLSIQDSNTPPVLNIDIDGNGMIDTTLTANEQQNSEASFDILNSIIDQMSIQNGLKHDLKEKIEEAKKEYKKGKTDKVVKKINDAIEKLEKEIKRNIEQSEEGDERQEKETEQKHKEHENEYEVKNNKQKISTEDAERLIIIIEQIKRKVL